MVIVCQRHALREVEKMRDATNLPVLRTAERVEQAIQDGREVDVPPDEITGVFEVLRMRGEHAVQRAEDVVRKRVSEIRLIAAELAPDAIE